MDARHAEGCMPSRESVVLPKDGPDLGQEAVMAAEREVVDPHAGWIAAPSRAAACDNGDMPGAATRDKAAIVCGAVDGVQQAVVWRFKNPGGGILAEAGGDHLEAQARMDEPDPVRQHLGLRLVEGRFERMNLAVDVADTHDVEVHQGHPPDARPCQGLDGPRADAAKADDTDVGAAQAGQRVAAQQAGDAVEAFVKAGHGKGG